MTKITPVHMFCTDVIFYQYKSFCGGMGVLFEKSTPIVLP